MNSHSGSTAGQSSAVAHSRRHEAGRQRGSVAVMAAIFLSIIVILLSSIDIGYMFYMKRNLQKSADLAALAGAQQLVSIPLTGTPLPTACAPTDGPVLAAVGNAQMNGFSIVAPNPMANSLTVTCGRWDPTANAALKPNFFSVPPAGTRLNAVRVVMAQNVPAFFGLGTRTLNAQAIASTSDPYAAFSVGSKLLQINNGSGVVPGLLSTLGLKIDNLSLLSYQGLANISITPNGLLKALGFEIPLHADVGTVQGILKLDTAGCSNGMCTLQALLGAISIVGGQQDLIKLLGLSVQQLNVMIPLLSDASGQGGIFALINAPDAQSALNAKLDVLTLLNTTLAVANNKNFAALGPTSISIPGVLNVATQLGVVEPPSIGIGGIGAKAYTAQVRLYAHIKSNLLNLNLINIDLPIIVDVVNGVGTLNEMCTKKINGKDSVTIGVDSPILSLCAGSINGVVDDTATSSTMLKTVFSTKNVCQNNLTNWPLLSALGGALTVNTKIAINALDNNDSVDLVKGQTASTTGNNLQIGTTLKALLSALLGAVLGGGASGVNNDNLATGLLAGIGGGSTNVLNYTNTITQNLQTFVNGLGTAVQSLLTLNILGLLSSVGNVVTGLLNSLSNILSGLLGPCGGLLHNSQECVSTSLAGSQGGGAGAISNVLLTILGIVLNLLQPVLDSLGSAVAGLLQTVLGIQLGQVDVTLLDLDCGGTSVKLVY